MNYIFLKMKYVVSFIQVLSLLACVIGAVVLVKHLATHVDTGTSNPLSYYISPAVSTAGLVSISHTEQNNIVTNHTHLSLLVTLTWLRIIDNSL